jgi:hypothetical protein
MSLSGGRKSPLAVGPYIAMTCDRQYLARRKANRPQSLAGKTNRRCRGRPGRLVADRETLADIGRTLDLVRSVPRRNLPVRSHGTTGPRARETASSTAKAGRGRPRPSRLPSRPARPWRVRPRPAARSRTAPHRARDRRRRISDWRRHRAAGSPWRVPDCRRAARS